MPPHVTHTRIARGLAAAVLTALVAMAPATAAVARQGVYGGVTKASDPIVIISDAKAKKITGAVFRIRIDGKDNWWILGERVKVRPEPTDANVIPTNVLVPTRNARGRFDTRLMTSLDDGSGNGVMAGIRLVGSLSPRKASGTIRGWVTVTDPAGNLGGYYQTKVTKWTAERAAGRVYGGATAADLPIVIKLDRRATKVADMILSCYTEQSTPSGLFWSASEWLTDFSLTGGRFGETFSYPEREPDGTTLTYDWNVAGRITSKAVTGTIAMKLNGTRPSGEPIGFQVPSTKFTAATG